MNYKNISIPKLFTASLSPLWHLLFLFSSIWLYVFIQPQYSRLRSSFAFFHLNMNKTWDVATEHGTWDITISKLICITAEETENTLENKWWFQIVLKAMKKRKDRQNKNEHWWCHLGRAWKKPARKRSRHNSKCKGPEESTHFTL